MNTFDAQLQALESYIRTLQSVVVCFSGGIDSALVLWAAHRQLGSHAIGLTAISPSLSAAEKEAAIAFAKHIGARHELIETQEIENPNYASNPSNRCFYCKTELYTVAQKWADRWGIQALANGTNLDDLGDYRPGLEAAKIANVKSPLVEVHMRKDDVRQVAHLVGLPIWDKPASACLSSRIPYGSSVTREKLAQIGGFEEALRTLGFRQLRVRWHDTMARIELDVSEIARAIEPSVRESIVSAGKQFGFSYITLDLLGYRQGSHNELLVGNQLRVLHR